MKRCGRCGESKKPEEFYKATGRQPDGLSGRCRPCDREYQREYRSRPEIKERNRQRHRTLTPEQKEAHKQACHRSKLRKYGLSSKRWDAMFDSQNGLCACCGKAAATHIDHDHVTDAVRGLVCHPCNSGIGLLGDCIEGVANALTYLWRHDSHTRRLEEYGFPE